MSTARSNQEQAQRGASYKRPQASTIARFNIYETIETPIKRSATINRRPQVHLDRQSSSSTSRLDSSSAPAEETQGLLLAASAGGFCGQFSERKLDCLEANDSNCDYSTRRRYLNFVTDGQDIEEGKEQRSKQELYSTNIVRAPDWETSSALRRIHSGGSSSRQLNTTNPYSEILLSPSTPVPSAGSASDREHTPLAVASTSYYQVPSSPSAIYATVHGNRQHQIHMSPHQSTVKDEMNQLIDSKRKKTLLLLKAKEAPRASFELTSPTEEETTTSSNSVNANQLERSHSSSTLESPVMSDYENLYLSRNDVDTLKAEPVDSRENTISNNKKKKKKKETASDCKRVVPPSTSSRVDLRGGKSDACESVPNIEEDAESIATPSELQNLNTLSIVSDILGDLSHEENSLVQQLSRG